MTLEKISGVGSLAVTSTNRAKAPMVLRAPPTKVSFLKKSFICTRLGWKISNHFDEGLIGITGHSDEGYFVGKSPISSSNALVKKTKQRIVAVKALMALRVTSAKVFFVENLPSALDSVEEPPDQAKKVLATSPAKVSPAIDSRQTQTRCGDPVMVGRFQLACVLLS